MHLERGGKRERLWSLCKPRATLGLPFPSRFPSTGTHRRRDIFPFPFSALLLLRFHHPPSAFSCFLLFSLSFLDNPESKSIYTRRVRTKSKSVREKRAAWAPLKRERADVVISRLEGSNWFLPRGETVRTAGNVSGRGRKMGNVWIQHFNKSHPAVLSPLPRWTFRGWELMVYHYWKGYEMVITPGQPTRWRSARLYPWFSWPYEFFRILPILRTWKILKPYTTIFIFIKKGNCVRIFHKL